MSTAVEVRGLRKAYGRTLAVDGLELAVPTGSVFGLLGPNGAGKSTTFGILCGWLREDAGSATVLGTPSHQLHRLRGRVAALPQDARFPDTAPIRVSLAHYARLQGMSGSDARAEAARVLDAVGLPEAADKRGDQLSHGMAKRAGIAQAMIGTPDVVFLDEPTAGLDPANARAVRDLIQSMAPRTTVVVSSHNLAEIQDICTHGAILDHGRLTAVGTMQALTRQAEEVVFVLRAGGPVPLDRLAELFGDAVAMDAQHRLRLRHAADADPAELIARALRVLLDAGTPILGVERGTSLESAFLELTRKPG